MLDPARRANHLRQLRRRPPLRKRVPQRQDGEEMPPTLSACWTAVLFGRLAGCAAARPAQGLCTGVLPGTATPTSFLRLNSWIGTGAPTHQRSAALLSSTTSPWRGWRWSRRQQPTSLWPATRTAHTSSHLLRSSAHCSPSLPVSSLGRQHDTDERAQRMKRTLFSHSSNPQQKAHGRVAALSVRPASQPMRYSMPPPPAAAS